MSDLDCMTTSIPVVAGAADLAVLRSVQPSLPGTIEQHLTSVELGGQELAEAGFTVDLVPVWAPLFLAWCASDDGCDAHAPDALQRFVERQALVEVRYGGYQYGPIAPVVELEATRSRAIAAVLGSGLAHTEHDVADVWARGVTFLRELYQNARAGTQVDVLVPSCGADPVHWHLDGTTCRNATLTVDHVIIALLEGLGSAGTVIVVDDGLPIHEVRVWSLGAGEVIPLPAAEASTICQPEPGSQLLDAWGL